MEFPLMISYLHLEACRAGYLQWQSTAIALANKAMQDTTYSSKVIGFIYVLHYNINARVKPKFFRDVRHNPFDFSSPHLCWSMLMAYPYRNMHSRVLLRIRNPYLSWNESSSFLLACTCISTWLTSVLHCRIKWIENKQAGISYNPCIDRRH